ncbi:MAG: hypothetical protein K6G16_01815 [Lachnospiraceae bacterium]|nr:hypothetical protein [Lachnospiraceae bacterium]
MGEHEVNEKIGRSEALIEAYAQLDRDVFFGDIPLSPGDLKILKEVRRSLKVFCPKWYDVSAYNKHVIDPLISHLVAIGYRAARYDTGLVMPAADRDGTAQE